MTDYKKYALSQVENFLYDAMSAEATAQEIYDTIKDAVQDNFNVYIKSADQARELLNLLNGYHPINLDPICDKEKVEEKVRTLTHQESIDAGWSLSDEGIWMSPQKKDKVIKWSLPVEEQEDGEYYITFPEDLLEAANPQEGDQVKWIDQGDGSYILQKVK